MSYIRHLDLSSFIQSFTQIFTQMYNRYIEAENSAKYMPPDGFFIGIQIFVKFQFRTGLRPGPCWESLQRSSRSPSWLGRGKEDSPPHFSPTRRLGHRGSVVGAQGNERAMMVNAYLDSPSCQKLAPRLSTATRH